MLHVHYKQTWSNMSNCDSQGNQSTSSTEIVSESEVTWCIYEDCWAEYSWMQWTSMNAQCLQRPHLRLNWHAQALPQRLREGITEYHRISWTWNQSESQSFAVLESHKSRHILIMFVWPWGSCKSAVSGLSGGNPWAIKSDAVKHEKGNSTSLRFFECSVQKNLFRF